MSQSNTSSVTLVFGVLLFCGCGAGVETPSSDSGTSHRDSGRGAVDAGTPINEGGNDDAGTIVDPNPEVDAGYVVDAGPGRDAGRPPPGRDAGNVIDAGLPNGQDAGMGVSWCAPAPTSTQIVDVTTMGVRGDGTTDDTAAIQAAVNRVGGTGGTLLFPDGTYSVNPGAGIQLRSMMTLRLAPGAVIKAQASSAGSYAIVNVSGVTDVNIIGGTIQGDKPIHRGTGGEWGHGVNIVNSSRVYVAGVTVKDCWGDGVYVGGGGNSTTNASKICNVIADNNRRQGLSIVAADGLVVQDSVFKNTSGTPPAAGIDVEPNGGQTVRNVQIVHNTVNNNQGGGIAINQIASGTVLQQVLIDGNHVSNNHLGIGVWVSKGHVVTNNIVVEPRIGISCGGGLLRADGDRKYDYRA